MGKSVVRSLIVFILCALLPLASWAAGLGRLSVLSSLGQPLRAEIEVVSQPGEDLEGLSAKLAPIEAYRVAKIEFADALLAVTASVQRRGNALVVQLSSIQPMNDPFIDVLVELNWASGRLVREYTFLLDPPEYRGPAQAAMPAVVEPARTEPLVLVAPATAPAPVTAPATAPAAAPASAPPSAAAMTSPPGNGQPLPAAKASVAAPAATPTGRAAPAAARTAAPTTMAPTSAAAALLEPARGTHLVKPGDTLGRVAQQYAIEGVSLEQMLISLQRGNPQAFEDQNINRLRTGQILQLPDRAAASAIEPAQARQQVAAQALAFREFRGSLAQAVAAAPARTEGSRQASGRVAAPQPEQPAAPPASSDQLRLSSGNDRDSKAGKDAKDVKAGKGPAAAEASVSKDDEVARQKMAKELQERIALLERNLDDIAKLEALKRQAAGAATDAPAAAAGDRPAPDAATAPTAAVVTAPVAAPPAAASAEDVFSIEAMLDSAMQRVDEALRGIDAAFDAVVALLTSLADSQDVVADLLQLLPEDALLALAVLLCPLLFLLVWLLRRRRALAQPAQESADAMMSDTLASNTIAFDSKGFDSGGLNAPAPATGFAIREPGINDDPPADSALPTPATTAPSGPDKPAVGGVELDFDLDFDTDPKPSVPAEQAGDGSNDAAPLTPEAVQPALDAQALSSGLALPAMLDFEIEAGESSPLETTLSAAASYQDTVLDFDLTEDAAAATAAAPATVPNVAGSERPAINFEGISLELDTPKAGIGADSIEAAPDVAASAAVNTPEGAWQEVEIKLDLAKAYLEMTDREGARELLKEAMAEGDAAQQQRAKTMLDSLA